MRNFPGGPGVENSLCNARDAGSIPGQGTKIRCATKDLLDAIRSDEAK